MNPSHHRWLQNQLPAWEKDGLITAENAARLRQRHALQESPIGLAQMIMGAIGALLIGSGIIAIIGYNWDDFARPVRLLFAFLPLAGSQVFSFYTIRRGDAWPAWVRECAALFQAFACGACLALVSQIYNLGGEWPEFLFAWCLLSLPIVWIMRSTAVTIFYLICICVWTVHQADMATKVHQSALIYPLLLVGLYPFWPGLKHDQRLSITMRWIFVLSVYVGLAGMITACVKLHTGERWSSFGQSIWLWLWSVAALMLVPLTQEATSEPNHQKPQLVLGTIQIIWAGLVMTFADHGMIHSMEKAVAVPWCWFVFALWITLMPLAVRSRRWAALSISCIMLVPLVTLAFGQHAETALHWLMNLYLLALGLALIILEFSGKRGAPRLGATLLCILILSRMMESELSLMTKGIAFILIGVAFLYFNIAASRLKRHDKISVS